MVLTVFQNRRWDGDLLTARRLLEEGALGAPVRFVSRFDRWRPAVEPRAGGSARTRTTGGGLLMDLGSHLIDQAILLFGRPVEVHGEVAARRPGAPVDDDCFVAAPRVGRVRSHAGPTMLAGRARAADAPGRAGREWEVHGLDPQEAALRAGARPGGPGFGVVPEAAWGGSRTAGAAAVPERPGDWPAFYAGVAACAARRRAAAGGPARRRRGSSRSSRPAGRSAAGAVS